MGWVADTFLDELGYETDTQEFWDLMRDTIGRAAQEFNRWVRGFDKRITDSAP